MSPHDAPSLPAPVEARPKTLVDGWIKALPDLGGGCQLPLGAIAGYDNGELEMRAAVASPDGSRMVRSVLRGPAASPVELGKRVAEDLLAQGAAELLNEAR